MSHRSKLILGVVGTGLLALLCIVGGVAYWLSRPPTTQLIDASGQELTTGALQVEAADEFGGTLFADVRRLIAAGDFPAARDSLLEIVATSDRDGEACVFLSDVMRELEDGDAAADYGLKAVRLLPNSPEAHLAYGKALGRQMFSDMRGVSGMLSAMRRLGPFKEALQRVIELDPDDTEARGMLVFFNLAPKPIGDIDRAITLAREIESRDPVSGKRLLAMCYQRKDEPQQAKDILLAGIEEFPEAPGLRVSLADIYAEEGRFAAADTEYEAARQAGQGEEYYRSLYNQARMRVQNEFEPERAIALLDDFIAGDPQGESMPKAAHACWRKGNALEQIGRDREALSAYEESLRRNPGFQQALDSLERLKGRLDSETPEPPGSATN